jgi:hypothetical protein
VIAASCSSCHNAAVLLCDITTATMQQVCSLQGVNETLLYYLQLCHYCMRYTIVLLVWLIVGVPLCAGVLLCAALVCNSLLGRRCTRAVSTKCNAKFRNGGGRGG